MIVLENSYFIYCRPFRKAKMFKYSEVYISITPRGRTILYKNNKLVIKIPNLIINENILINKICNNHDSNPYIPYKKHK